VDNPLDTFCFHRLLDRVDSKDLVSRPKTETSTEMTVQAYPFVQITYDLARAFLM
jgi:hypothetical protein